MADTRVGAAGARIVYHDAPAETASAAGYLRRWTGTLAEATPATRTDCDFVTSCGCLVRRAALDAVGGFDRDYFTSYGDVDLCLRIQAGGWRIVYEPSAVIRHKVARGGTRTPERVYYVYRNKLLLLRKHVPGWWQPALIAGALALGLPKALVGSLRHHRGLCPAELRMIALAAVDAAVDRRGESPWAAPR